METPRIQSLLYLPTPIQHISQIQLGRFYLNKLILRLQVFHLLKHDGAGGKSLFVDGFNCANQLRQTNPIAYEILSTLRVPTVCAGDDYVHIQPSHSFHILNHNPVTKELYQIRYNNDDRSLLSTLSISDTNDFYYALRQWMKIVKSESNEVWTQLGAGTVVAFDNWRILHGRSSFSGYRRMVGCYISWDDYQSRIRIVCDEAKQKDRI